jgi:predicted ArsR family transcriptional regulator
LGKVNQSYRGPRSCHTLNPMTEQRTERRPATEAEAKALASGFRLRILRLCLDRALTNKELAQRLDSNPATVLHHVRTLVATGFLAAQEERRGARGAREVPYRATRRSWQLDLAGAAGGGAAMVEAFLDEMRHIDVDKSGLTRLGLRLTDAEHLELRERLQSLIDEYADRPPQTDGKPYSLFLAVYEDVTRA